MTGVACPLQPVSLRLLAYISALLTLTSVGFYLANLVALRLWKRQPAPPAADIPVSVLKPLKGADPEMYECFRAHCLQEYGAAYEIIFGVNAADDPAVEYVRRLQQEFPQREISLLVCGEVLGANRKVSNLVQMARQAKYSHLLINDSDISVPRDYLSRVMRWFANPKVGMVTCLYRGLAAGSVWSKLEALGIIADFMPGALTARMFEARVRFGLGSTMAVSREALAQIGGFETLVDYLADDYELANHLVQAGYEVVVPDVAVQTTLHDYRFRDFWEHQVRWGRTVRSSRFGGYLGIVVTFGILWAVLWLAVSRGSFAALIGFAAVVVSRLVVLLAYGHALGDELPSRLSAWMWLRDLITPLVWVCSMVGNTVVWRGEKFRVKNGKLQKL